MPTLHLKPRPESLPMLYAFCEELGVDSRILLALEEAFVNVANYSGASFAELRCERHGRGTLFILEDDGAPFDPTAHEPPPEMNPDAPATGGQGIRIMRSMADSMAYRRQNQRNILTLTKYD